MLYPPVLGTDTQMGMKRPWGDAASPKLGKKRPRISSFHHKKILSAVSKSLARTRPALQSFVSKQLWVNGAPCAPTSSPESRP